MAEEPLLEEYKRPQISWVRKILICAFIIGFWVFYYWYEVKNETPTPPQTQTEETPKTTEETPLTDESAPASP